MIQGTTPSFKLNISNNLDLNNVQEVWVTFKVKNDIRLHYTKDDVIIDAANHMIYFTLTQEESLRLPVGNVDVQLRILIDDKAYATPIQQIKVTGLLKGGVLAPSPIEPAPSEPTEPNPDEPAPAPEGGSDESTSGNDGTE